MGHPIERLFIHSFQTELEFGELFFVGAGYEVFSIYFFFKVYMFRFILFQPQRGEVTFHLPLHRHLAAFISLVSRLGRFLIIPPILSLAVVHKGQFIIYMYGNEYHIHDEKILNSCTVYL